MTINVYLADDHSVMRDGLRALLEIQEDLRVVGDSIDASDALREIHHLRPNIVLMDIAMPGLSGIEATYEISQNEPSVQVIILSMYSEIEHVIRALKAGARGYLLKESAGDEVVKAIRDVYQGHRYLSPKISDQLIDRFVQANGALELSDPLSKLSPREVEVLRLLTEGYSNAQIAECLSLSPKTVETYRSRLMHKLEIGDLASLIKFAIKQGVSSID